MVAIVTLGMFGGTGTSGGTTVTKQYGGGIIYRDDTKRPKITVKQVSVEDKSEAKSSKIIIKSLK